MRKINFEDIEKNRWNGTVHYGLSGNPFGYFWYLKAVVSEWSAIVENNYETVMPLFNESLKPYQLELLPELGPYSIHQLNDERLEQIGQSIKNAGIYNKYALNHAVNDTSAMGLVSNEKWKASIRCDKINPKTLTERYGDEIKAVIEEKGFDGIKIKSGLKPEELAERFTKNKNKQNALMRIMYNAMHRGLGFSSALFHADGKSNLATSFFIQSHDGLYEIASWSSKKKYRQMIHHLLLQNNAGRLLSIHSYHAVNDLVEIGYDLERMSTISTATRTDGVLSKIFKAFQ
jgi:hypothetical protein